MSYIGRGVDAISNVEKLDNITFDGSATYALTKSSAAFTPVGANNILISIDGVIQQGNFSVSTTNIVFDWSPTSSNTCNFILHYGTGVLNVPADGSIVAAKMAANSVDSASYVDGSIDAVHLSANSVDSDAYVDASIDNAHLADDAVGVAELSATGTASSSTFLRGDNAWAAPTSSASAGEIVACKIITIRPGGGVSTTSGTYAEISSSLRITHSLSDASNKLIFWFHSSDAYIDSGLKGSVGIAKTTDVTDDILTAAKELLFVKSAIALEAHNINGFAEYAAGATTEFIYTPIHKVETGSGTFYINNTSSGAALKFCLMEVQQ
jgi:hypothetical protein